MHLHTVERRDDCAYSRTFKSLCATKMKAAEDRSCNYI